MSDLFDISLTNMIKEAEREAAMRRAAYPRQVAAGKMTGDLANRRIATMQKIVDTLKGHVIMLTITSCEPRHEPGFSRNEALELARRFEIGNALGQIHCENWDCDGHVDSDRDLTPRQRDTIVAALRAYAR